MFKLKRSKPDTKKVKPKKDRLFVIVLAIVVGNLAYQLMWLIADLINYPLNYMLWLLVIANVVGIIGILWLIRTYRKGRRLNAQKEEEEQEAS